jgi:hypothetical protein
VHEDRFVIESAPIRASDGPERGVVGAGAVGSRWAGWLPIFRHELLARKRLEHLTPQLRPLDIAGKLTRQHQRATHVRERLQRRRLAPRRRRHRLIQPRETTIHIALRDLR